MNRAYSHLLIAPLLLLTAPSCRDQNNTETTPDLATANPDLSEASQDLSATVDSAPTVDMRTSTADLSPAAVPTEFVVVRVGDGAAALSAAAAATFLERRKISDGSLVDTAIALPTAVAAKQKRLTLAGNANSEGGLSLSEDRKFLILAGYDADVGTATVATSTSAAVNRVVGVISAANVVDTTTAADFFNGTNPRGATSTDGTALWVTGSAGTVYTTRGTTTAPAPGPINTSNLRWPHIFNGQLYVSSSSGTNRGISTIGTGTPKTAAAATRLTGFETQALPAAPSAYGFVAFDRDATPGIDVIYVADDNATGGGVERWSLSAGKWQLDGTMAKGLTAGARGVTGYINGNNVVIIATIAETPARVVSFVDDGTTLALLDSKELAKAGTNTAYRGVALAPQ